MVSGAGLASTTVMPSFDHGRPQSLLRQPSNDATVRGPPVRVHHEDLLQKIRRCCDDRSAPDSRSRRRQDTNVVIVLIELKMKSCTVQSCCLLPLDPTEDQQSGGLRKLQLTNCCRLPGATLACRARSSASFNSMRGKIECKPIHEATDEPDAR